MLVVAAGGLKMKSISIMPDADGSGGNLPFFWVGPVFLGCMRGDNVARRNCF